MNAGRRSREDPPDSEFRNAVSDARPLDGRDRLTPSARPPRARSPAPEPVAFVIDHAGEQLAGRAPGIDRRHLRRLRRGEVAPESETDLHGLRAPAARRALRRAIAEAVAEEQRCLLVVHGRGSHSKESAVLKKALPTWLGEPEVGEHVMAFASARAADGGAGATYVLLRRPR